MTTYFMGSELDALLPAVVRTNDSNQFAQAPYSRGGVEVSGIGPAYVDAWAVDPATGSRVGLRKLWFHAVANTWGSENERTWVEFLALDGTPVIRLACRFFDPLRVRFQYWRDGDWRVIEEPFWGLPWFAEIDVRIDLDTGELELFAGQTNIGVLKGLSLSDLPAIAMARMFHTHNERSTVWQQVIIADYMTVGHKVRRIGPSVDGATSEWSGGVERVSEQWLDDSSVVSTSTPGAVELFAGSQVPPLASGMTIKAVGVASRARATGEDGVANAYKVLLGTAESSTIRPQTGFGPHLAVWDVNPATGAPWGSDPAVLDVPFGFKAV